MIEEYKTKKQNEITELKNQNLKTVKIIEKLQNQKSHEQIESLKNQLKEMSKNFDGNPIEIKDDSDSDSGSDSASGSDLKTFPNRDLYITVVPRHRIRKVTSSSDDE